MATTGEAVLDRERRLALPAGLGALAAVAFVIASIIVASSALGGSNGEAEYLQNVHGHETARIVAAVLQAIGVGLLALPLSYLFRAASARSERVRGQLIGVVIAGPIFLAIASVLTGVSALHAADDFVSNELPTLLSKGVKIGSDRANEVATETSNDASLRPLAAGFGIGGQLGFVIGMAYTALHAMRTGLVSRFWGSLGVALGVISFFSIFFQLALLWYLYLGALILGRVPGGKPPAWETGTAVPWPTPGERMSAELGAGGETSTKAGEQRPDGDERASEDEGETGEPRSEEPPKPRS